MRVDPFQVSNIIEHVQHVQHDSYLMLHDQTRFLKHCSLHLKYLILLVLVAGEKWIGADGLETERARGSQRAREISIYRYMWSEPSINIKFSSNVS